MKSTCLSRASEGRKEAYSEDLYNDLVVSRL